MSDSAVPEPTRGSTPTATSTASTPTTATAPKIPENPNVATLRAAFPDVDAAVISAVLVASSNNLEKAFDGLLGMSDPNFKPDMPMTHDPVAATATSSTMTPEQQRQILADEQFARQLASHGSGRTRPANNNTYESRNRSHDSTGDRDTQEHSFLDDDLPVLKENIIQGFNETKLKVGSFISNLRTQYNSRMEQGSANSNNNSNYASPQHARSQQSDVYHNSSGINPRSSTQYDVDARSLDDDFGELQLQDNTTSTGLAIPNAKKQGGEAADNEELVSSVGPSRATPNTSRWKPLDATPAKNEKKDDFSLGDDEDDD